MFRPMASIVSALLGVVAKWPSGRASVSSSPSKIPYGGFSPVRLQIDIPPRPSPPANTRRSLIRGPQSVCPVASLSLLQGNRRTESALGNRPLGRCRSRGPWLPGGLYCPARSSLTMASSEALDFTRRLMFSPTGLAKTRDSLLYSACPSVRAVCRTPSDRAVIADSRSARGSLRPFVRVSASAAFHAKVGSRVACLSRLHSSLYAAARTVASPAPTPDVYFRAFIP
jgi:hypothetical protein